MSTSFDLGKLYAEFMVNSNQVKIGETVNVDKMVTSSRDIPDADYMAIKQTDTGIPNSREYWYGYNAYMIENNQ